MYLSRREFIKQSVGAAALATAATLPASRAWSATRAEGSRPNIILIVADDMGYSDIGCFGSEISTPNLDGLAARGMRMSQYYSSPRCCPSRACLLTGLYPHQVGFGLMADDYGRYPFPQYAGDLSQQCVTIPEALKAAGYSTAMAGKWHLTPPNNAKAGKRNWPLQRGFHHYFGNISGAASYYNPATLTQDNDPVTPPEDPGFYYTDAVADHAAEFVAEMGKQSEPFFLYCAFTAPHWPLQAPEELVQKYARRYADGWDRLREERHARQLRSGLLRPEWQLTPRDPRVPAWSGAGLKEWEMRRMAVYAAMIERMDQGIGRIMRQVEASGKADNTLIVFMSDNGGNAEELGANNDPNWKRPVYVPYTTRDGKETVLMGNRPRVMPGPENTYQSLGIPWGNCTNTPFRLYKHYTQEGGISSPFIACWPRVIKAGGKASEQVGHESDLMPTFLAAAGAAYPKRVAAGPVPPMVGESLLPVMQGRTRKRKPIFWEHEGNKAVRDSKWKLVSRYPEGWELYDMEADRTELHDLASQQPERVKKMAAMYDAWAKEIGVQPWPLPGMAPNTGKEMPTPPYLKQ